MLSSIFFNTRGAFHFNFVYDFLLNHFFILASDRVSFFRQPQTDFRILSRPAPVPAML